MALLDFRIWYRDILPCIAYGYLDELLCLLDSLPWLPDGLTQHPGLKLLF
jgi:hypothetical protein